MGDLPKDLTPHYSSDTKVPKVNNVKSGTISEMVKIIKESKKIIATYESKQNENTR